MNNREFKFRKSEFNALREIVYARTGIHLKETKFEMVYSRLARRIRALHMANFADYLAYIKSPEGDAEAGDFVNAMTTNLTRFFRESHHFQYLRNDVIKPKVEGARKGLFERKLRIWSAGCSSGMEPYSIAMTVKASLPANEKWDVKILATDIDTNMLNTGRAGLYRDRDCESIPPKLLQRFVTMQPDGKGQMNPELRSLISFKYLNLMDKWPVKGPFDAIFCRNVMIYFDVPTQQKLVKRYMDLLGPEGLIFVGHAEALVANHPSLISVGRSSFRVADDYRKSA